MVGCVSGRARPLRPSGKRELDPKMGAGAGIDERDRSPVSCHDATRERKAEPRASWPCADERIEERGPNRSRYAGTIVHNINDDGRRRNNHPRFDVRFSRCAHCNRIFIECREKAHSEVALDAHANRV